MGGGGKDVGKGTKLSPVGCLPVALETGRVIPGMAWGIVDCPTCSGAAEIVRPPARAIRGSNDAAIAHAQWGIVGGREIVG